MSRWDEKHMSEECEMLREDRLLHLLGQLPDDILEEALEYKGAWVPDSSEESLSKKKYDVMGSLKGLMVAGFCIAFIGIVGVPRNGAYVGTLETTIAGLPTVDPTAPETGKPTQGAIPTEANDLLSLVSQLEKGGQIPMSQAPVAGTDAAILTDFSSRFAASALASARDTGLENPVWSPVSAYLALMGVAIGTQGQSQEEFEQVLGLEAEEWPQWSEKIMAYMNWIDHDAKVGTANSVWSDESAELTKGYRQSVSQRLFADVYQGDLSGQKVMKAINKWVDDKTGGMIPELRTTPYEPDVTVAILNAVYLEQQWEEPFSVYRTKEKIFYTADNQEISVKFLQDWHARRDYVKTDRYDGILLPYDAGNLAFVALRPTAGQSVEDLLRSLTTADWKQIPAVAADTKMNFSMPKFEIQYQQGLDDVMKDLGLQKIMTDPGEDLTPMGTTTVGSPLGFFGIGQTVKIQVDEEGTKAAAVTEATAGELGPVKEDDVLELHFDHPYIYAILDQSAGLPLFIGVMDCPPGV